MEHLTIDDYLMEITLLQQRDTALAHERNMNKLEWISHIKNQPVDEIADAIKEVSSRYGVALKAVAKHFDSTMVMRVNHSEERKIIES